MAIDSQTLQNLAMFGLGDDITKMNPQQLEDALYGRSEADINRRSGLDAQAALENTFARGVGQQGGGPSTITSQALDPIMRTKNDALMKARMDAFTASQSARLAALGQAAAVSQNALNSGASAGAQQQALNLQKRGQDIQGSAATNQMIGQGVGGLGGAAASTAALLYPNKIRSFLGADRAAGDTQKPGGLAGLGGGPMGPPSPTAGEGGLAGLASAGAGPSPVAPSFGGGSFSPVSFDLPSSSGFGAGGGLGDLSSWNFSPQDFGMEDWLNNVPSKSFDWGSYL